MRRDLEQIVREQGDMVLRLALAHTGNRTDAEDVFQEVFIRLVRSLDKIESEDHLRYWLIRVTINRCKSLFSSAYRKREVAVECFIVFPFFLQHLMNAEYVISS